MHYSCTARKMKVAAAFKTSVPYIPIYTAQYRKRPEILMHHGVRRGSQICTHLTRLQTLTERIQI